MLELDDSLDQLTGDSTDELLKKLLLKLLSQPANPVVSRLDRLEEALIEGMKRSRSRTFGSNG